MHAAVLASSLAHMNVFAFKTRISGAEDNGLIPLTSYSKTKSVLEYEVNH